VCCWRRPKAAQTDDSKLACVQYVRRILSDEEAGRNGTLVPAAHMTTTTTTSRLANELADLSRASRPAGAANELDLFNETNRPAWRAAAAIASVALLSARDIGGGCVRSGRNQCRGPAGGSGSGSGNNNNNNNNSDSHNWTSSSSGQIQRAHDRLVEVAGGWRWPTSWPLATSASVLSSSACVNYTR
jgi:hypothetical protein